MVESVPNHVDFLVFFFFPFLLNLHSFLSLIYFINHSVLVEVDFCLANHIVRTNNISIPHLNLEDIGFELMRIKRQSHREFPSVIEGTFSSASPMRVSLQPIRIIAHCSSQEKIVGFSRLVSEGNVMSFPNDDSELTFHFFWRRDRISDESFFFSHRADIDPHGKSTEIAFFFWMRQRSHLYRLILVTLPMMTEISSLKIDSRLSDQVI
mmetsp:Transcript_17788/g.20275  ORF Transcript_17788/g.20275 Transcript_17788/m.20275 type:complete len:209 (-) Transcript_17788:270-896(-)